MRGKGVYGWIGARRTGITPAYAGKRCHYKRRQNVCKDHPRLCGEKNTMTDYSMHATGSPPPMRGKGSNYMQESDVSGITPAYAGKRSGIAETEI